MSRTWRKKMTPSNILWLIREGTGDTWAKLCSQFGLDPEHSVTPHGMLRSLLENLRKQKFIIFNDGDLYPHTNGKIRISSNWEKVQSALNISLAELAKLRSDSMIVTPYFGNQLTNKLGDLDLFILMPFRSDLKPIYDDHISNVAKRMNLVVKRADDFFTSHSIMSDIWEAICKAKIIIADCTGRNPNVFYEIGIAHTIGKPIILITQNSDDVPFDIRHLRYIKYDFTPRGMSSFEEVLCQTLQTELEHLD